jgi:amino acid transporter
MLYGDWGTSRFYVLGLALFYAQHASFWFVAGVCALVAAVGWAYTIICRCYPDGGGVYSAARHTSRALAVVGALLLFADYIVTASLSAMDGMHYLQIKELVMWTGATHNPDVAELYVRGFAVFGIFLIGAVNFIGPKKAGTFALFVAIATLILTVILVVASLVPHQSITAVRQGWSAIHRPTGTTGHIWHNLVNVVLALSGVEAIANMTGIMVPPVGRTSRKAIWPVLLEVVIFNLVLAVAMNALPAKYYGEHTNEQYTMAQQEEDLRAFEKANPRWRDDSALTVQHARLDLTEYQRDAENRVLWVMAREFVGRPFAAICGIVFGLLLLSAVNTAVADMVSIQYVMARDTELPRGLLKLNIFGVPWRALIAAVALPSLILLITGDLDLLAGLYAIGVVGAIAINLGSCCLNREMALKMYERMGMGLLAAIMIAIELTLAVEKPSALLFAGGVLIVGLSLRFVTTSWLPGRAKPAVAMGGAPLQIAPGGATALAIAPGAPEVTEIGTPAEQLDMTLPKVLVATRGGRPLLDFAATYSRRLHGVLLVMFVRQINVVTMGRSTAMSVEEDSEAQEVFKRAAEACRKAGISMIPLYVVSPDVAYAILDHAATYNVESVLMGVSREGALLRALRGDVLTAVADHLPADIPLLIHA